MAHRDFETEKDGKEMEIEIFKSLKRKRNYLSQIKTDEHG